MKPCRVYQEINLVVWKPKIYNYNIVVFQHFFNGYCTKTKEHLHKFDEEFSKELKKKEEKVMLIIYTV